MVECFEKKEETSYLMIILKQRGLDYIC
jgi:hypothetical protein